MRGGSNANPRQAWYDRNPLATAAAYAGSLAPHAVTQRFTYTVPAGRKANIELVNLSVTRLTAAGVAAQPELNCYYVPSGGSTYLLEQAIIFTNVAGDRDVFTQGASFIMAAGDRIYATTDDGGTGGTVYYVGFVKYTEYDA